MKTKTFRGLIADGGIDKIYLAGDEPGDGYRIVKFQLMAIDPISNNQESVVKIFSIPQSAGSSTIDFSDNTLLAAGYLESDSSGSTPTFNDAAIVFDNVIFNQDIYVTHIEQGSDAVNYYIELEQVKLSNGEQAITNFVAALNHGE